MSDARMKTLLVVLLLFNKHTSAPAEMGSSRISELRGSDGVLAFFRVKHVEALFLSMISGIYFICKC